MDHANMDNFGGHMKISKISIAYTERENALRLSMLNKIGVSDKSNPCTDGTATCGSNTICAATGDENYECNCLNGYTYDDYSGNGGIVSCVDIDECSSRNLCSESAECMNTPGGYECRCYPGYYGNGYECISTSNQETTPFYYRPPYDAQTTPYYRQPHPQQTTPHYRHHYDYTTEYAPPRHHSPCDGCHDNAVCIENACFCKEGFYGDGYQECNSICSPHQVFRENECVDSESPEVDDCKFNIW